MSASVRRSRWVSNQCGRLERVMGEVPWHLSCVRCGETYAGLELRYRCDCSGTLDVIHDLSQCGLTREILDARLSSKVQEIAAARGEGSTNLYNASEIGLEVGVEDLWLKRNERSCLCFNRKYIRFNGFLCSDFRHGWINFHP